MTERTTSSSWALSIVQALELEGLDCQALFSELGLDYCALSDPDARFAQDGMTRLWQRAVEMTGNPAIGLNLAKVMRPGAMHVVGYALMSSSTLRDSFQRLVRYQRIIAEGADLQFRPTDRGALLTLAIHGDQLPPARQSADGSLASTLAFCRWLTGKSLVPLEVYFQGPRPADVEPYQAMFQAPLRFNADSHGLLMRHVDMDIPLPTANAELAQLHDRFCRRLPGTLLGQPGNAPGPAGDLPSVASGRTAARNGSAVAATVRAYIAAATGRGGHELPAVARRHPAHACRAISGACRSRLAGSGLSAGLCRSEQFLPRLQALVRDDTWRIPRTALKRPCRNLCFAAIALACVYMTAAHLCRFLPIPKG